MLGISFVDGVLLPLLISHEEAVKHRLEYMQQ